MQRVVDGQSNLRICIADIYERKSQMFYWLVLLLLWCCRRFWSLVATWQKLSCWAWFQPRVRVIVSNITVQSKKCAACLSEYCSSCWSWRN